MAITFGKKKTEKRYVLYTIVTAVLLCVVFGIMMGQLYVRAEETAYEDLHKQTKQIKDDIHLQLVSDRENLATMANFAANLYREEERYTIMFDSFKPIGLIENIGILNADNTFVTRAGVSDVSDYFSFEEEVEKGAYISSRVSDVTTRGVEIVRSAVPIQVDGQTVGILYGVIQLSKIGEKYDKMAKDLNAQLFVYDKASGDLIIDNVHDTLGNISFLKDRKYRGVGSYEEMMATENGFTSFASAYRNENAYLHYSTIEDLGWMIAVARYDSNVFAEVRVLAQILIVVFLAMIGIVGAYILILLYSEKRINEVTACAAAVRRTLLETSGCKDNVGEALKQVCDFAKAGSLAFFDTMGERCEYVDPQHREALLTEDEKTHLRAELLRYVAEYHEISGKVLNVLCITPNKHLAKVDIAFYTFLKEHHIHDISLSATTNTSNHTTILAALNAKRGKHLRMLAEKISACFSIALYNKNHLNKTTLAATTDSLTGAMNRVAYKTHLAEFDETVLTDFSCIYVDVNELHLVNNTKGHAAGDEMLLFIANTLKEVFYGHNVYRMGGDEFLVFCQDTDQDKVKKLIDQFLQQLTPRGYHVAVGLSYRKNNPAVEEMVHEAESRMYVSKAQYYQTKEQKNTAVPEKDDYDQIETGILEIDTMLSILKEKYHGIYRVSLSADKARRILMPAYMKHNENEEHFSVLFSKYISQDVESDYHRAVMSFLNYDVIKSQLAAGKTPKITYKKLSGETVVLSVYGIGDRNGGVSETLWMFAKA